MSFVNITPDKLDEAHICCALGAKQYDAAVRGKKDWLRKRMQEGLVFYRLDERAKVFIEYLPGEAAWAPVHAPRYMFINCLWVSGKYKGEGYGRQLLEHCIEDAKSRGMDGIVHVAGGRKLPYLSDKKFFLHHGFEIADTAGPYFELIVQKWNPSAATPAFHASARELRVDEQGIAVYYTAQCPYAAGIHEEWREVAYKLGLPFHLHHIQTREEAQRAPVPWTTYAFFYNGRYVTHEIMSGNKLEKLLTELAQQ